MTLGSSDINLTCGWI